MSDGEGGMFQALSQMDGKTCVGFIAMFVAVNWLCNRFMAWFDTLPWRKELREKAQKVVDDHKAKEAAEEARKNAASKKEK